MEEEERVTICNNCEHVFVVDKEMDSERFMFVYCELTMIFCYSLYLPDGSIIENGYTCGGKWFKRRPIFEIH